MQDLLTQTQFDLAVCVAVFLGFAAILFGLGKIGRSNVYRGFMIAFSALICAGYATQHFVYEEPSNFMGFPLMGIVCWGGIGLIQIVHIHLNIQRNRLEAEQKKYEDLFRNFPL
jgi:hypothetical protein